MKYGQMIYIYIYIHITTTSNTNDNTANSIKPKIATIVYDDAEHYYTILDHIETLPNDLPIQQTIENNGVFSSQYELQQPCMYQTQGIDDDESYNTAQAMINHLATLMDWNPTMNTIIEETPYDMEWIDNSTKLMVSNSVSGKQQ
jgi:hypothetical protein